MWRGKKNVARTVVYDAIELLTKKFGGDRDKGVAAFNKALDQVSPAIEVRPRRVGGSVYQIPVEVPYRRAKCSCDALDN